MSFVESGIQTRLKMVPNYPWEEVTHVDRGSIHVDLAVMDDLQTVLTRREDVAADLVVVITSGDDDEGEFPGDDCGTSLVGDFVAIDASCLHWGVLAHELGHKFKLAHDWYTRIHVDGFPEPTSWESEYDGHGYVQIGSQNNVRTPMSYKAYCVELGVTCRLVSRWSNPADYSFNNLPLGIWQGSPYPSNELRVINQTRVEVARHKDSICRLLSQC